MIRYYLEDADWELTRGTPGASGYDLRADISIERTMEAGERWLIATGLYLGMPLGCEAQVRSRSGLAINHGVIVLNAPGTVDSDYRGEVRVSLINLGKTTYTIQPGDRIAQLVFAPVYNPLVVGFNCGPELERVKSIAELGDTSRGASGHGSTGR